MKNRVMEGALACVGAVIGAGFVSGREIITFFSRYGQHSWWLILISAAVMTFFCSLCMRCSAPRGLNNWCDMYQANHKGIRLATEICVLLLLMVIGGAMVSASGQMFRLLWPSEWAYPIGAVGTLGIAWLMSRGSLKPLSWISSVLTLMFFAGMLLLLKNNRSVAGVTFDEAASPMALGWAAIRAVAYASMNIAIAIGVVCKAGERCCRRNDRLSAVFGFILIILLFMSNYLYLKHPELQAEAFPVVRLFAAFGREGFIISVVLLYLGVFTTLTAVVYALRSAMTVLVRSRPLAAILTLGCPMAISLVGFVGIVDKLYTPVGLLCLALVFLPLMLAKGGKKPAKP